MQKQKNVISKKTERMLMKVLAYIEAEPRRLEMGNWGEIFTKTDKKTVGLGGNIQKLPPCKTVACLAGTVLLTTKAGKTFLKDRYVTRSLAEKSDCSIDFPGDTNSMAKDILGLTTEQMQKLFYFEEWSDTEYGWPAIFVERYMKAKTARGRFGATKARVLHFIKTGE